MQKKSYLFHTYALGMTGGSKSILSIAEGLNSRGHSVSIIMERHIVKHAIPKGINIFLLGTFTVSSVEIENNYINEPVNGHRSWFGIVKSYFIKVYWLRLSLIWIAYFLKLPLLFFKNLAIKRFLNRNKIDVVVSSNMYRNLEHIFFYKNKVDRVYMSLRNSPHNVYRERITPRIFPLSFYYKNVTCIGVSEATTTEMADFVNLNKTKLVTIYNPFDFNQIIISSKEKFKDEEGKDEFYVCVANLSYRKRVDLTIKGFDKCSDKVSKLYIIGDGDIKDELQKLVSTLGIENRVLFLGEKLNPYKYIAKAKGLILTSESEGLPRVLIESLVCNTPVISTDCPTGPSEILRGNLSDFLISLDFNEEHIISELAMKIDLLNVTNPLIDRQLLDRFEASNVIDRWQKL